MCYTKNMTLPAFGFILTTLGELLIGYSILKVHLGVRRERKIDKSVVSEISNEIWLTLLGMILIIIGFFLQLSSRIT